MDERRLLDERLDVVMHDNVGEQLSVNDAPVPFTERFARARLTVQWPLDMNTPRASRARSCQTDGHGARGGCALHYHRMRGYALHGRRQYLVLALCAVGPGSPLWQKEPYEDMQRRERPPPLQQAAR